MSLGLIIPDLVDDVSNLILNELDLDTLEQLRFVSTEWYRYWTAIPAIDKYFPDSEISTKQMTANKGLHMKILVELNIDLDHITKEDVEKITEYDMLHSNTNPPRYLENVVGILLVNRGNIENLRLYTDKLDNIWGYHSVWGCPAMTLQSVSTHNPDMIKYCLIESLCNFMPEWTSFKINNPGLDLSPLEPYFDFSKPNNRSTIPMNGNLYIPPSMREYSPEQFPEYEDDDDYTNCILEKLWDWCKLQQSQLKFLDVEDLL